MQAVTVNECRARDDDAVPSLPEPRLQRALASIPCLDHLTHEDYEVTRLDSFTNATYQLKIGGELFALRLPGTGTEQYIDRGAEEQNAGIAASAGLAAPVVWFDAADGTMLTRWVDGSTTTAEMLRRPEVRRRAASTLARVHSLSPPFRGRYDVFEVIRRYREVLSSSAVRLPPEYGELARAVEQIEQALGVHPERPVPCHNDPYPGNLIDTGERICLIDWEYAGMGDPMWDLADLSVEASFSPSDDEQLLVAYYGGHVPQQAWNRLALFEVMSDVAWGVWSFVQLAGCNPAVDYRKYGGGRLAGARRQVAATGFGRHLAAVARGG